MAEQITNLEGVDFQQIYDCFIESFSDYSIDITNATQQGLYRRTRKNNWIPELSCGVWVDSRLVAITLVGVDVIKGQKQAYDICTGIIPGHRGQKLAGRMLEILSPSLLKAGVSVFGLEVLQDNVAAIRAYQKAGFSIVRGLIGFEALVDFPRSEKQAYDVRKASCSELLALSSELDYQPSYEQRDQAIRNLADELIILGVFDQEMCVASLAFDPATHWLMRLVTARSHRRTGAARTLLACLAHKLESVATLKAINVDENDAATQALLTGFGMRESVRQWEMLLEL